MNYIIKNIFYREFKQIIIALANYMNALILSLFCFNETKGCTKKLYKTVGMLYMIAGCYKNVIIQNYTFSNVIIPCKCMNIGHSYKIEMRTNYFKLDTSSSRYFYKQRSVLGYAKKIKKQLSNC